MTSQVQPSPAAAFSLGGLYPQIAGQVARCELPFQFMRHVPIFFRQSPERFPFCRTGREPADESAVFGVDPEFLDTLLDVFHQKPRRSQRRFDGARSLHLYRVSCRAVDGGRQITPTDSGGPDGRAESRPKIAFSRRLRWYLAA